MTENPLQTLERIEGALELFEVLAHPVRLRLLMELCREEECVCHLATILDRPQPYISQQLAELRRAGLVLDRRDGQRIYYRIVDQRVGSLLAAAGLCADPQRPQLSNCPCPKCG